MERGICGEEDRGTYPAWTFTSPWLPSHLLPQPRLWLTLLRGHLHHLPTVPFCSLLLLATKWWGSCVGGRGVLIATVCEAWQRDRYFQALFIKKKNQTKHQQTNQTKQLEKASLEASLPVVLSRWVACLLPCLCSSLSILSSFPNLQISCFQASSFPLWGPSFKYGSFRNPSDSLFSLS